MSAVSTRRGVTILARPRRGAGGKLPKPSHCRLGVREVFSRFDADLPEGDLTDAVLEHANRSGLDEQQRQRLIAMSVAEARRECARVITVAEAQ